MNALSPKEKELFYELLDLPSREARVTFLDQACAGDQHLRSRLEELAQAHEAAGEFLTGDAPGNGARDKGPVASPAVAEGPGNVIDRYKLLQKIGEGGFGVVYMAEQREPVKRRVALKIIKMGMDTRQVVGRFEAERQALAMMDHPNIAKVLDAGATDTGRPYFVMELVRGVPILEFCDEHQLTPRARLELFTEVCSALQHAHQKGIIHRDIKPSNVLITMHDDRPVPKVIDFGIAKATQQELTDKTIFTRFQEFIGTPAYMSPEQAQMSGLDIDTRSDIYSLGVLLYELLTGYTPFEAEKLLSAGYDEMRRLIREEDPPKPSTRLKTLNRADRTRVARHRQADPHRLDHQLRGELDWIVMKAMEKDRRRRYESASALAQDVERYLKNEPITAAAPSLVYKFQKFARRHRAAITFASLLVVLLIAGAVTSTYFAIRATRAEGLARKEAAVSEAVNRFLNEDLFAQADPGIEPDREIKLKTLLDRASRQLGQKFQDQPLVEGAIHSTLGQTYLKLGEYAAAERHLRQAFELTFHELGERHEKTLQTMSELSMALSAQNKDEDAVKLGERVLSIARDKLGPTSPLTVSFLSRLAWIRFMLPNSSNAFDYAVQAVDIAESQTGIDPKDYARALMVKGRIQGRGGNVEDGEAQIRHSLDLLRTALGDTHPQTLQAKNFLAGYYYDHRIKLQEAERLYRSTLDQARQVLGESHQRVRILRWNLILLYSLQERYGEALYHQLRLFEFKPERIGQVDLKRLQEFMEKSPLQPLVSPSQKERLGWQVRTTPPLATWTNPDFIGGGWEAQARPRAESLWLRQDFELTKLPEQNPIIVIRGQGDFELFLNGVPLPNEAQRSDPTFQVLICSEAARLSLRAGRNVLAVHGSNLNPAEDIDIVLYQMPPPPAALPLAP